MKIKQEIKDKIIHAANTLQASGVESPTNEQIREHLGGGSLSHISPVMREWRDAKKLEMSAALEIPADLKRIIETSLSQVWTVAKRLASAEVDIVKQEAGNAIEIITTERDEALTEILGLEEVIANLKDMLNTKDQSLQNAEKDIKDKSDQMIQLSTENALLKAKLDEKNEQVQFLKREVSESRSEHKKLQEQLIDIARRPS